MAKVLVAIADFGGRPNTTARVRECFNHESFEVMAFSTEKGEYVFDKSIGEDLPFVHRAVFADRINDFDYFIFTENDIIYSFETISTVLDNLTTNGEDFPMGVIRHEHGHLIDFAAVTDRPRILQKTENAFLPSNVHQASYFLTRGQLQKAIESGNYLIAPSARNGYGKLETAASNVYFECGMTKVLPIRGLQDLLVEHVAGIYHTLQPEYKLENLYEEIDNCQT